MKTNNDKKDVKSSKKIASPVQPLVLNTAGGEMPEARREENSELKNAQSAFSTKSNSEKIAPKH
jgi:hypothetical protein